jgi:hypothetical protein
MDVIQQLVEGVGTLLPVLHQLVVVFLIPPLDCRLLAVVIATSHLEIAQQLVVVKLMLLQVLGHRLEEVDVIMCQVLIQQLVVGVETPLL